jgi:predicted lipid carrier protein YhbT
MHSQTSKPRWLAVEAKVPGRRLEEFIVRQQIRRLRRRVLDHGERAGSSRRTQNTTALDLLFVTDKCIVVDGVSVVNSPAVKVSRAGGNF